MSDTPAAAPSSAPAAAPAATPAPVHHAALQPREQGKFAGPPDPANATAANPPPAPEAPKTWKLGNREFRSPEELHAYAAEKDAEARALDEYRKQATDAQKRARELEERTKDPLKGLSPEHRQHIIAEAVREWQEHETFQAMTPEQQHLYRLKKQLEHERATLESEKAERQRVADEAKAAAQREQEERETAANREELKASISAALAASNLQPTATNIQAVVMVLRGAAERGVIYPPEVVARKVKERFVTERREYVKALEPTALLSELPELVEKLEALEDAGLLRKFPKLGEKLRRLNLESLGATPPPAQTPVSTGATASGAPVTLPKGDPGWAEVFKKRARGQ